MTVAEEKARQVLKVYAKGTDLVQFDPITILMVISIILSAVRLAYDCGWLNFFNPTHTLKNPGPIQRWRLRSIIRTEMQHSKSTISEAELTKSLLLVGANISDEELRQMEKESREATI